MEEAMEPEVIADYPCITGEGPLWHPDERKLYWVDIPPGRLYRWDPAIRQSELVLETDPIGGFTIQDDGSLLLCMAKGAVKIWKEGQPLITVIDHLDEEVDTRFNDVIADPAGRVFGGTMRTEKRLGNFYRIELDGTATKLFEGVGVPNGMGFTPDRKQMYFTDTFERQIYIFDYDEQTGNLSNRRTFIRTPEAPGEGFPDGMTVDANGDIWSARWDGYCVVHYSKEGKELDRIKFPSKKVSCPTFGGPDYEDMFVTTAGGNDRTENGPTAGATFRVRPGVKGVPEFRSRVHKPGA
jgi:sugar lactone lactonase YvrE